MAVVATQDVYGKKWPARYIVRTDVRHIARSDTLLTVHHFYMERKTASQ